MYALTGSNVISSSPSPSISILKDGSSAVTTYPLPDLLIPNSGPVLSSMYSAISSSYTLPALSVSFITKGFV